jgi:hypothetical protein
LRSAALCLAGGEEEGEEEIFQIIHCVKKKILSFREEIG